MKPKSHVLLPAALCAVLFVGACSGGGDNPSPEPTTPQVTITPEPTNPTETTDPGDITIADPKDDEYWGISTANTHIPDSVKEAFPDAWETLVPTILGQQWSGNESLVQGNFDPDDEDIAALMMALVEPVNYKLKEQLIEDVHNLAEVTEKIATGEDKRPNILFLLVPYNQFVAQGATGDLQIGDKTLRVTEGWDIQIWDFEVEEFDGSQGLSSPVVVNFSKQIKAPTSDPTTIMVGTVRIQVSLLGVGNGWEIADVSVLADDGFTFTEGTIENEE